ncbi:MAG: helix-turn-helix domain-containing protein [Candidatus Odinarchaeota archaeon]
MPAKSDKTTIINEDSYVSGEVVKSKLDLKNTILDLLGKHGPLTRDDMVEFTGIPRTTLYDSLDKLILSGKVEKYVLKVNKKGRPTVYYELVK